ncbi:hypothetical protein [Sorangium cellulosum]|uniref:hypothetical protein n=1 Tax=Sorangium cellulosum TaxID=56 RepID=UPI000AB19763|nr:hypothetical protein [Sorangium cellulosum]
MVDGCDARAPRTADAIDGHDGSQRCANCGVLGLRTVALLCPKRGCGEAILENTTASEADLRAEAAREHTCTRCGTLAKAIEMIECPSCLHPVRADVEAISPPWGAATGQSADEAEVSVPQIEITVDEEFSKLIPPLSPEELAQLERHLLAEGCHDPLLVWDDGQQRILMDGHNRYQICRRHRIRYTVRTIHLSDRDTARTWILEHQLGRRNLTPEALAYLRGKLYSSYKHQGARTDLPAGHSDQRLTTAGQLAAAHHVGEKTIRRDAQFAEQLDQLAEAVGPDIKHAVLARDAKISRTDVGRLLKLDSPIRNRIVARSREGEPAARLIKDALAAAGRRERPSPTASAVGAAADTGCSAIQPEALTGATVMQVDVQELPPTTALRPASPANNDALNVVEQSSLAKVIRALAEVAQALNQVTPGEIQADILLSIRERLEKVQLALQAHEAVHG